MLESIKSLFLDVIVQDVQPQDIISVNIWAIIISLANLVILFLILKRFLFKPVKKMLDNRQKAIDNDYSQADEAKKKAKAKEDEINQRLSDINQDADEIIKKAEENAKLRSDSIIDEATKKADQIIDQAKIEAELEKKAVYNNLKQNVTDVSIALAEKMLEREVSVNDHRALIDSFINEVGDENGSEE